MTTKETSIQTSTSKCSAGRSGYDIRADVLSMAKDFVIRSYDVELEIWKLRCEAVGVSMDSPEFPTVEQILEVANKMNDFVGKK